MAPSAWTDARLAMTSKRLTPEQVHAVGLAAVKKAVALVEEGAILLDADRPQRAYALGVVGVEKLCKYWSVSTT